MNKDGRAGQLFHNSVASRVVGVTMCVHDVSNPQLALVNFFKHRLSFKVRFKSGIDDDGVFGFCAAHNVTVSEQSSNRKHLRDHGTPTLQTVILDGLSCKPDQHNNNVNT